MFINEEFDLYDLYIADLIQNSEHKKSLSC